MELAYWEAIRLGMSLTGEKPGTTKSLKTSHLSGMVLLEPELSDFYLDLHQFFADQDLGTSLR